MTGEKSSMRVKFRYLSVLCVVAVLFCFSGCLFRLETPTLTYNNFTVSWSAQNNANSYEVVFNGESYDTTETSFNYAPYITTGKQTLKVRAFSGNVFVSNSDYTDEKVFYVSETKLTTPASLIAPHKDNSYTMSWNAVAGADMYLVSLEDGQGNIQYFETTDAEIEIRKFISIGGEYTAKVRAMAYDVSIYGPSAYSEEVVFDCPLPLNTPENVKLAGNTLQWTGVDSAVGYRVTTLDGETIETTSTSANVSNLMLADTTVFFVQATSSDGDRDSAYSNGIATFEQNTKSQYASTKFDFLGNEFDLVADSAEELKSLVYYTLLYRIENMQFYVDYLTNNNARSDAIVEYLREYNEIKAIDIRISFSGELANLTVSYLHVSTPNLSATGEYTTVQNTAVPPTTYVTSDNKRSDDFDDFAIDTRTKTALVFTSDQLYYALQNGCKPIFASDTCPAKVVYDEAKAVLRDIIGNDMSDYQKVCAIYEWITYNTVYDHNLYALSEKLESGSNSGSAQATLSRYRGFYIEGVLLDNGQAVCDGLAKTFVLLCSLENIDCYKVSGLAGEGVNINAEMYGGAHAWNKVKLVAGDNESAWYIVDTTWADMSTYDVIAKKYIETMAHEYFLVTDADLATNHLETEPATNVADVEFNYYANTQLGQNVMLDLYAENYGDLVSMLLQAEGERLDYLEFEMSSTLNDKNTVYGYVRNNTSRNYSIMNSGNVYMIVYS